MDPHADSLRKVVNLFFLHFKREEERLAAQNEIEANAVPFQSRFERVNFVILTFFFRGISSLDMEEFADQFPHVTADQVAEFYETDPEFVELKGRYDPMRAEHQRVLSKCTNIPPGEFSEWRLKSVFPQTYGQLLRALEEADKASASE